MFDTSTEAMQAQIQSKLGMELDNLWQKVIDYRDTQLIGISSFKARYSQINNFFMKNCALKFMDLVWKYVGLWISEIKVSEIWNGGFVTCSYMGGNPKKPYGAIQIGNILSGGFIERYIGPIIPTSLSQKDLLEFVNSFDKAIGGIKKECREQIRTKCQAVIGFDIRTAFLLEDWLAVNSGVTHPTAQEITAIVLHELGHTLNLVEHAAAQYARAASFNYLAEAYKANNSGNVAEAIQLAKKTADAAEKLGRPKVAKQLRRTADMVSKDIVSAGNAADLVTTKKLVNGFFSGVLGAFCDVFVVPFDIIFGLSNLKLGAADKAKKFGDLPVNARLATWEERKADEYAAANGYAAPLTSCLRKIDMLVARVGKTEEECARLTEAENLRKKLGIWTILGMVISAPVACDDYNDMLYPAGSDRFKEVLNTVIRQLKANGADPEYVQKYMKDIEIIKYNIDHYDRNCETFAKIIKSYEVMIEYISIPSICDMLVHGKIKRELDILIDDLQVLTGNLIQYYGLKLQQIANKG